MPVVQTNSQAGRRSVYGLLITKFSRMGSLPHFFTHGTPLCVLRVRELHYQNLVIFFIFLPYKIMIKSFYFNV